MIVRNNFTTRLGGIHQEGRPLMGISGLGTDTSVTPRDSRKTSAAFVVSAPVLSAKYPRPGTAPVIQVPLVLGFWNTCPSTVVTLRKRDHHKGSSSSANQQIPE